MPRRRDAEPPGSTLASYICAFLGLPTDYTMAVMRALLVIMLFRSLFVIRLARRILYALWLALWDRLDKRGSGDEPPVRAGKVRNRLTLATAFSVGVVAPGCLRWTDHSHGCRIEGIHIERHGTPIHV